MFRTQTGQTGKDAYSYTMQALLNEQRELNLRFVKLMDTISEELPEDASYDMPIPSDKFPDATLPCDREGMVKQLAMCSSPNNLVDIEFAWQIIRSL